MYFYAILYSFRMLLQLVHVYLDFFGGGSTMVNNSSNIDVMSAFSADPPGGEELIMNGAAEEWVPTEPPVATMTPPG